MIIRPIKYVNNYSHGMSYIKMAILLELTKKLFHKTVIHECNTTYLLLKMVKFALWDQSIIINQVGRYSPDHRLYIT